jgi:hypothetical protein
MIRILVASAVSLAAAGAALSAERCDVPTDQWQPREALQKKLEAEGWTVKKIKVEDGCYEAYATNAKGEKMETFFDPKTFEAVGNDG